MGDCFKREIKREGGRREREKGRKREALSHSIRTGPGHPVVLCVCTV